MKQASGFWKRYWLVWAVLGLLAFLVPEGIAIFNDEAGDTLTEVSVEHLWSVIGPEVTVLVLVGFFSWLVYHFVRRAAHKRRLK